MWGKKVHEQFWVLCVHVCLCTPTSSLNQNTCTIPCAVCACALMHDPESYKSTQETKFDIC